MCESFDTNFLSTNYFCLHTYIHIHIYIHSAIAYLTLTQPSLAALKGTNA